MKLNLNFAVFYQIVFKGKIPMSQVDAVNFLLKGVESGDYRAMSDDVISSYVSGAKPLTNEIVNRILSLREYEISNIMKQMHIQQIGKSCEFIKELIEERTFDISESEGDELLRYPYPEYDAEYFLARVFIMAVNSPRKKTTKLTEKQIKMLNENYLNTFEENKAELLAQMDGINMYPPLFDSINKDSTGNNDIPKSVAMLEYLKEREPIKIHSLHFGMPDDFNDMYELVMNIPGVPESAKGFAYEVPNGGLHKYFLGNLVSEHHGISPKIIIFELRDRGPIFYDDLKSIMDGYEARLLYIVAEMNYPIEDDYEDFAYLPKLIGYNPNRFYRYVNDKLDEDVMNFRAVLISFKK